VKSFSMVVGSGMISPILFDCGMINRRVLEVFLLLLHGQQSLSCQLLWCLVYKHTKQVHGYQKKLRESYPAFHVQLMIKPICVWAVGTWQEVLPYSTRCQSTVGTVLLWWCPALWLSSCKMITGVDCDKKYQPDTRGNKTLSGIFNITEDLTE